MPSTARQIRAPRLFAALLAAALLPGVTLAQRQSPPERSEHDGRDEQHSLSDAVRRVERATKGQVLSAERVQFDGRDVSRVKVVDGRGRVRVYWDDPESSPDRRDRKPARDDDAPRTRRDDAGTPTL